MEEKTIANLHAQQKQTKEETIQQLIREGEINLITTWAGKGTEETTSENTQTFICLNDERLLDSCLSIHIPPSAPLINNCKSPYAVNNSTVKYKPPHLKTNLGAMRHLAKQSICRFNVNQINIANLSQSNTLQHTKEREGPQQSENCSSSKHIPSYRFSFSFLENF